jgi:hypothetical protein
MNSLGLVSVAALSSGLLFLLSGGGILASAVEGNQLLKFLAVRLLLVQLSLQGIDNELPITQLSLKDQALILDFNVVPL